MCGSSPILQGRMVRLRGARELANVTQRVPCPAPGRCSGSLPSTALAGGLLYTSASTRWQHGSSANLGAAILASGKEGLELSHPAPSLADKEIEVLKGGGEATPNIPTGCHAGPGGSTTPQIPMQMQGHTDMVIHVHTQVHMCVPMCAGTCASFPNSLYTVWSVSSHIKSCIVAPHWQMSYGFKA